ncbi:MAG TPA: sigma-70 family RNA polymerase sigma factor, partial [Anaerolineales bacterium]|nr:sigma-70 family RNA polymerase sigma factor [Anaerolineales bacterium]
FCATFSSPDLYYTVAMTAPTDRDLILRARRGDAEAYGELVTRYQTSIFNVCYRILHERGEAEDLAQESFIRAYDRINTFDIEREFGPWIRRVAANVCLNHLESQPKSVELNDERDAGESQRPEAVMEVHERSEHIRRALASLPPHYRLVIELRHYQELSYDEIAGELDIPLSDVKSHLFRARKLLAEKIHASD